MSDFKAKMHHSISAGALPQTPLGELTVSYSHSEDTGGYGARAGPRDLTASWGP